MSQDREPPAPQPTGADPAATSLPAPEQIAAWIAGEELSSLGLLFDFQNVKSFDALVMQIRKEELLPQHWQVISRRQVPDSLDFQDLGEVRRLRHGYQDGKVAQDRIAALEVGWRELGGRQPALWTVADLMAILRRAIDLKIDLDFYELLAATRDIWAGLTLPHGRAQLENLWAILIFMRQKAAG